MNPTQTRKILERIQVLESDISTLCRVRMEVMSSGFSSATMASSNGSRSYTYADVDKINRLISLLQRELGDLRALLGGASGRIKTIQTIYR